MWTELLKGEARVEQRSLVTNRKVLIYGLRGRLEGRLKERGYGVFKGKESSCILWLGEACHEPQMLGLFALCVLWSKPLSGCVARDLSAIYTRGLLVGSWEALQHCENVNSGARNLGSSPTSTTSKLCDHGQATYPLCASVIPPENRVVIRQDHWGDEMRSWMSSVYQFPALQ